MPASTVSVELDREVFEALQCRAKPFVDTPNSVIKRLIELTSETNLEPPNPEPPEGEGFVTSRGVTIPFGTLRATYKPRGSSKPFRLEAKVTSEGIEFADQIFDNPSSAGIHAKELAGAKGSATSTNGWEFWEHYDPTAKRWIVIDTFRRRKKASEITLKDLGLE